MLDAGTIVSTIIPELQQVAIGALALFIVLGIVWAIRTFRLDSLYQRYERQLELITEVAPDIIIRIAFNPDQETLQQELVEYEEISQERVANGLSYIDPRMLYAIDRIEGALPEEYQIDLNVVIDRVEVIYLQLKQAGMLDPPQ